MSKNPKLDQATGVHTVGHEWDGIEELNNPLPRWWLWTLYLCIIWAVGYTVLYPAWPMLNSATAGTLGWSSTGDLKADMAAADAKRAPIRNAIAAATLAQIEGDEKLYQAAIQGGNAAFKVNCVQCHGSGAAGSKGYPNLNDDDWLWGGDLESIHTTLTHGIRNPDHEGTRMSQMPAFGEVLAAGEVNTLVSYVAAISDPAKKAVPSAKGAELFANNCASCHGVDGKGLRAFGAPNLTDGIWLYGGDRASIHTTISKSRQGVMPKWTGVLDPVTIKMLAVYVHSLGGGEKAPTPATTAPAPVTTAPVAAPAAAAAAPATTK